MRYERSKAPLALMEQIIMILVFALTAAVCLQAFVYSDSLSRKSQNENLAAAHAQDVAEYMKELKDIDAVSRKLSGRQTEKGIAFAYPEDGMTVYIQPLQDAVNGFLLSNTVFVEDDKGETLFSIDVGCQRQEGGQS